MAEHERENSELDLDEAELEADTIKVPDEEESAAGRASDDASADSPAEDPAEDAMGEAAGDTLKAPDAEEG